MTNEERPEGGQPKLPHPIARGAWMALGFFFVALGIIGALLPIMPTTIFLILAAGCFTRSSPRFESWLLDHRHFGPTLRAWRKNGAISTRSKAAACGGMALGYGIFCLGVRPHAWLAVLIGIVLAGCAAYVLTRPAPGIDEDRG